MPMCFDVSSRAHRHRAVHRPRPAGSALISLLVALSLVPSAAYARPLTAEMGHARDVTAHKIGVTHAALPTDVYTVLTDASGAWTRSGPRRWVSGMLPGQLWFEYQRTDDAFWRSAAEARGVAIRPYASDTRFHDIGFMFLGSDGLDWRLTGDTAARERLLQAARSLATRYDPRVRMVRTLNTTPGFRVYNDTMMNVELLYRGATLGGGPAMREAASQHALRTIEDFLRPDGSSYHYVFYDERTGAVVEKGQGQGYAAESTWARGQAWIIYGLSVAFRETGDLRFADGAWKASRYWIDNVPSDLVPYWDFDAPNIPNEPRDSSAAATAASAFIELGQLDPDPTRRAVYCDVAWRTMESLCSDSYLSRVDEPFAAVLKHGTYAAMLGEADHGTSWGDYYFSEALQRLSTQAVRAAGPDRYKTAVRVSQTSFEAADTVVIAGGRTYADALSASGLAGLLDAPVLLTHQASLPPEVATEIRRLGATRVIIVGGVAAVSEAVEYALGALPGVSPQRIAGPDRYSTSARVAEVVVADVGYAGEIFLVRGDEFADALSIASVAYSQASPVLLTSRTTLGAPAAALLGSEEATSVVLIGGPAAISSELETAVKRAFGVTTVRLAGADRYATGVAVAEWALSVRGASMDSIGIVTGEGWPDALAGGPAVGSRSGVLLMTQPTRVPGEVTVFLGRHGRADSEVRIFGGEAVVAPVVENRLGHSMPDR